ncbi:MAG: ABC transporter permease [Lachnospiraceae bacterium]|jgi:simple sugar transport system permease protein|nr:ABC transporter permease [Lachnospiraceae bacterium]MCH4028041.1 ABC transporter permease [Lachnospiraceae bacterium]MCH4065885.1 ABC transporter permease [Lachnospiraceae bacterium]MCH4111921.1 ABC transporter permease [Lachnospiraceae bacterium]MCI1352280.1 ABC transporter permease [Lachnospiraceae bacterium]
MEKKKSSFLRNETFLSVAAAIICILVGLLVGFLVLLAIKPEGAWAGILAIIKNFFNYPTKAAAMKYLGNTLVKTAPLLMCALSINFCYKVGLFNIGAAGQYVVGAAACLYAALAWNMPWYVCMILAMIAGGIFGLAVGFLKAYANVNEVISGIMLNWIGLYLTNMILGNVKESTSPYTVNVKGSALIPSLGLSALFSNNKYVTIAVPLSIVFAILVWVVLEKTKFGYELRATGYNKDAAKYAGMNEKKNIILTLMIGGCLAGLGAAFLYLTGYEQWSTTQSSVPGMGFNGIAATFLGGLSPIGTIFASFFIQHITSGGSYLDKSVYPSQISDLISAIIIYLCGFVMFFKLVMNRRAAAREEAKAEAAAQTPAGASVSAAAAADARQNTDDGKEEGGKKE